jgi:hypothetical protein
VTGAAAARLTRWLGSWPCLLVAGLTMAITQTALGLTSSVVIAAITQLGSSGAFALFNMTAVTMQQRLIPAELLGRPPGTCVDPIPPRLPRQVPRSCRKNQCQGWRARSEARTYDLGGAARASSTAGG